MLSLPDFIQVLPGHTSVPLAFDGVAWGASGGEIRRKVALADLPEGEFVAAVLARIPPNPPNHLRIVNINEGKEDLPPDLTTLEAGANRGAVKA